MKQLHLPKKTVCSSEIVIPSGHAGEERIISLVKAVKGTTYVNLPRGRSLYDESRFKSAGLDLEFLPLTAFPPLNACGEHLSILDLVLAGHEYMVEDHLQRFAGRQR
jgi:hypothetical protein